MARPLNRTEVERVDSLQITKRIHGELYELAKTGYYGSSIPDVIRALLYPAVRKAIARERNEAVNGPPPLTGTDESRG